MIGANLLALSPLGEHRLESIVKFQNRLMPTKKHWSIKDARSALMDTVHQGGKNVLLAVDRATGDLQGLGAWIIGGNGESFGAPFFAATEPAAFLLLEAIEKEARAARSKWLRVITLPSEVPKAHALQRRNFRRTFDFVEFEINPLQASLKTREGDYCDSLVRIPALQIDFKKYVELGNLVFSGVDNALPLSENEARDIWKNECDCDLSQVLADRDDVYVGFTVVTPKGYIDSVGVHPDFQGRGIARALYETTIRTAAKRGMARLYTVVSSNNVQSLRLHERMGFAESERRQVWELHISAQNS